QGTAQDIVLRPADDYVANFVQHVDRGKVLKVGAVMLAQHGFDALPEASIATDASIAEALQQMAANRLQALRVQDPQGQTLGVIPFQDAINAYTGSKGEGAP
ncbi:proline/glycine betaine ABC transporter ATP-binding protein, partial [Paracoccus sp. SSJ]|nr:proline/glycine betaine ABC transporter ATP-binding protein [Paracoccus sp. SSJ]